MHKVIIYHTTTESVTIFNIFIFINIYILLTKISYISYFNVLMVNQHVKNETRCIIPYESYYFLNKY